MKRLLLVLLLLSMFSGCIEQKDSDSTPDELKPYEEENRYYSGVIIIIVVLALLFFFLQGSATIESRKLDRKLLKKRFRTIFIDGTRDGIFEIVGEHLYNGEWAFDMVGEGDNFPKQFINPETDLIPLSMKNVATGRRAIFITTDTVVDLTNRMGYNPENIVKNVLQKMLKDKKMEKDDIYTIWGDYLKNYKHQVPPDIGSIALTHVDELRKAEEQAEKSKLDVIALEGQVEDRVDKIVTSVEKVSSAAKPKTVPKKR